MDTFFYKKFQDKTDQELKKMLLEKEKYTKEAITTSYKILKERNVNLEDFDFIETEIENQNLKLENQSEGESENAEINDLNAPELYSKQTILGFSIFFSTIFGVVLLMINMHQIKNLKGKNQVLLFGIAYFLFTLITVQLFKINTPILGLVFNLLGALILNEYYWNKFIGKDFNYEKKNWLKTALLCLLITSVFLLIAIQFI